MHIEMKGINKAFTSNQVLKNAGSFLKDGEVHALMGENGAGKSTLMKILTGVYQYDSGTILVDGKEVRYKNPQEAEKAGIVFIYQELNVLFDLTVEETCSWQGNCQQVRCLRPQGYAQKGAGNHGQDGRTYPGRRGYVRAECRSAADGRNLQGTDGRYQGAHHGRTDRSTHPERDPSAL